MSNDTLEEAYDGVDEAYVLLAEGDTGGVE
ncbi:hypothetical protein HLRTI_003460 [Halorhabdus tiamatea SARL4B]|uniref:Uncharacterized protein n=1 Tax=Halorhabdus tiamatea SARL4B TaxID=1033806 RepID=U2DEQ5_9EURY|nr:hypothetical protein HLRTI_003460 [Halorhabdus tiamatea SARL4B]